MANILWTHFISLITQLLLGDPRFRYAPSSIAKVLDKRFLANTHAGYLLPGAMLGRLLFLGQNSIIFYPITDCVKSDTQELSISDLFEKCHQEFMLEFYLKSKTYDYLIFPIALQKRQHWATLVYDVKQKNLLLVDSSSSLVSSYDHQTQLVAQLRDVFSNYELSIESFHYVSQGLQKDNVHCGAWTLANTIAIDSFGLDSYLEKIQGFYHQYLNPKDLLETPAQEIEDDFVIIDYADLEEDVFEQVDESKLTDCIKEQSFELNLDKLMPSTQTVNHWLGSIIGNLSENINDESFILKSLSLRDSVQFKQQALSRVGSEQLNLSQLLSDLDGQQLYYRIKDPDRQRKRFEDLGFSEWINHHPKSIQVVYEALLHDACSYEAMLQEIFGKCAWLNKLGMLEAYLQRIKVIENHISLQVIEFLHQAEKHHQLEWQKRQKINPNEFVLSWLPQLILRKSDFIFGSSLLVKLVNDCLENFDERLETPQIALL